MKKKNILSRLLGDRKKEGSEQEGNLNIDEKDMIRGVVELSDTTVKEILVPRIDVIFLPQVMDFKEMLEKVADSGHSRFPVYSQTIDTVIGILYVKDLLRFLVKNQFHIPEEIDLAPLCRKAFHVPETVRLDSLLKEFKRRRVHIAVAVDEHGGVSGITCLEDIIEEIVGDLQDEFDNEMEDILKIGDTTWLCDARVSIDELNEQLGLELPNEDFETLGGFVFDLFGKIPVRFEKFTYGGAEFIVQTMDGNKIRTVKIHLQKDKDHES